MVPSVDVFVSLPKEEFRATAEKIARDLRAQGLKTISPLEVGGFGVQLKQAAKHGAKHVVLFGDSEFAEGKVLVKNLEKGEQTTVGFHDVSSACR
jgi:histidyl-tRNA synthetase